MVKFIFNYQVMKNLLKNQDADPHLRVLLVEDDEFLTEMMQEVFQQEGYHYKCISAIDNIIQLMFDYQPQVVILDYILPKVNGGELCSQIKQHVDFCRVPVIIYSAYSKVLLSLGNYGCDSFIEKPFDLEVLIKEIRKLSKRKLRIA